jgi:replicative DNA helicase
MQGVDLLSVESEKVVLSSILMDNTSLYKAGMLKVSDFSTDIHRQMFQTMQGIIAQGGAVDHVVLHSQFNQDGKENFANYLLAFDDGLIYSDIDHHVKQIRTASQRRRMIAVLRAALAQAEDLSEENADVVAVTHERLMEIASDSIASSAKRISDFSAAVYESVRKMRERGTALLGLSTGIPELDRRTTGLRRGEYVVIGAVAGDGKTAYALQIIVNNLANSIPVLMFSQEMSKESVLQRCIPQITEGQITARKLRNPADLFESEYKIFTGTRATVDTWPLWVNDASSVHITEMIAQSHMMIQRHAIKLIVVDYLQLVKADAKDRYDKVSKVSEALRELAKDQKIPVIAISQLSRPNDKIKRRPSLFDLRESGQIEQDAHLVLLLYRPLNKSGWFTGEDEVIIAKQREGPVGSIPVVFNQDQLRYVPREKNATAEPTPEEEGWWQK